MANISNNISKTSNELRWSRALGTLESTKAQRSKTDRRAKYASLVGIYIDKDDQSQGKFYGIDVIVAVQPDRSSGRKFIFMERTGGDMLGYILLEDGCASINDDDNMHKDNVSRIEYSSKFRGMEITKSFRGRGFSTLFMSIWLGLCLDSNIKPLTVSLNKPLLALSFIRFGFKPILNECTDVNECKRDENDVIKKRKRKYARKTPIAVEVSRGYNGTVNLYCHNQEDKERLEAGFVKTEMVSQNLSILKTPANPRGRRILIRTCYMPPVDMEQDGMYFQRLRLNALHGERKSTDKKSILREIDSSARFGDAGCHFLTGKLEGFVEYERRLRDGMLKC